jgi:hypothetical protein
VQFDEELEHIRWFLATQKPSAVSKAGSPIEATTDTEAELPTEPSSSAHSVQEIPLHIHPILANVASMPPSSFLHHLRHGENVRLLPGSLSISCGPSVALTGEILVRNLAYSKAVDVRFTFDEWATVSQVTTAWKKSVEMEGGDGGDVFRFTIKLDNYIGRIEEKRLVGTSDDKTQANLLTTH